MMGSASVNTLAKLAVFSKVIYVHLARVVTISKTINAKNAKLIARNVQIKIFNVLIAMMVSI